MTVPHRRPPRGSHPPSPAVGSRLAAGAFVAAATLLTTGLARLVAAIHLSGSYEPTVSLLGGLPDAVMA